MPEFVIVAHQAPLTPDIQLDDLPGAAGRLDVLCRCVTAGLLRSHGIRTDTQVTIVVRDELAIRFDGDEIRRLQPDERSTAARFRTALEAAETAVGRQPIEADAGITVARWDLAETLARRVERGGDVVILHEDGDPIVDWSPPDRPVFVLSDHQPFGERELETIEDVAAGRIRLGPVALHADQAITVTHNYLDTSGYACY